MRNTAVLNFYKDRLEFPTWLLIKTPVVNQWTGDSFVGFKSILVRMIKTESPELLAGLTKLVFGHADSFAVFRVKWPWCTHRAHIFSPRNSYFKKIFY